MADLVAEISPAVVVGRRTKEAAVEEVAALPEVSRVDLDHRALGPPHRLPEPEIDRLRGEERWLSPAT